MHSDIWLVFEWWATLFLFGAFAFPIVKRLFAGWYDDGYLFAKAVGIALVTYIVYLVGSLRLLPFTKPTIFFSLGVMFIVGLFLRDRRGDKRFNRKRVLVILFEELLFFSALLFWSWIKGHQPDIHDLEKFMDFGFMNSALHSRFFPAPDMWYAGGTINYYYFGHVVVAVLTKFSGIDLSYTFNLMLASIFAFTLTMSFSIARQIGVIGKIGRMRGIISGFLTAFLVTLAGNLQTIYAFTPGYAGDVPGGPPPFWQLGFSWKGLMNYWYANATRFIPYSIHEFPSYSFVVSDVHGHVLSLPFVLLAVGILLGMIRESREIGKLIFYGFLVGVLLMTNALDGPIYFALFIALLIWGDKGDWGDKGKAIAIVAVTAGITSLPFLLHFKSFVSGIALNCPPTFLANMKVGPLLFEGVEKCQRSAWWMLLLLWGFFLYCGLGFLGRVGRLREKRTQIERFLLVLFVFSVGLILFAELFYFKDIYPMHFRSNTMFKLGYQAFILFGIVSGYAMVTVRKKVFYLFLVPLLFLVSIFPYFSVRSYFRSLATYEGLYGFTWFAREYPDDYAAIEWLKGQMKDQGSSATLNAHGITNTGLPVLVEADGDSYTDYARVSTLTGAPTIIGWAVHEWLWRGTYDVVAPRREDVVQIYESQNIESTRALLTKYHVRYIFVGTLERRKYSKLMEEKFSQLGKEVFRSGQTVVYSL